MEECKYPTLMHFANVTDNTWDEKTINATSLEVMNQLDWEFRTVSPASFLMRYVRAAQAPYNLNDSKVQQLQYFSEFYCDVAIAHSRYHAYNFNTLAAASVALGRMSVGLEPWNGTLAHYTKMSFGLKVREVAESIFNL